jgi:hypothetical protein
MVSFNKALAGTLTSTFISNAVGLPSSQYPTNTIFAYHPQLNYDSAQLANNILQYAVIGFAPCRKFIISWEAINVAGAACSGKTAFFQIILHESNVIDLQMAYLSKCGTPATRLFGIQDGSGSNAFSVPGFNTGSDSVLGKAWRFYPDVVDNLSHLAILSDNGIAIDSVIPTIQGTQFLAQFNKVLLQYPPSQQL